MFSGMKNGARSKVFQTALSVLNKGIKSLTCKTPTTSSTVPLWIGILEKPLAITAALTTSHDSSILKAVMSVRGVITCLASLSPNFTIRSKISFSSVLRLSLSVRKSAFSRSFADKSCTGLRANAAYWKHPWKIRTHH